MSVKSTIKSFIDHKSIYSLCSSSINSPLHGTDSYNVSLQLNHISKMIEDCVISFTKRYLIVSTELEEMKREFIAQSSTINEYLTLTKKEILFDKFDKFNQGKPNISIPQCPNYERKCLIKNSKTNSNINIHLHSNGKCSSALNSRNGSNTKKGSNSLKKSKSRLISPEISKKINNKVKQKLNVEFDTVSSSNNKNKKKLSFNSIRNNNLPIWTSHTENNFKSNEINKLLMLNTKRNNKTKINMKPPCKIDDHSLLKHTIIGNSDKEYNNVITSITSPFTKAIYIAINKSEIFTLNEKIILSSLNKNIISYIQPKDILMRSLTNVNNKILLLETNIEQMKSISLNEKESISKLISYPSNTAKSSLNLLTKQNECELMIQDDLGNKELLKMIIVFLGIDELTFNIEGYSIEEIYGKLFDMYKVNSIKSLFYDVIYKVIYYINDINAISKDNIVKCIEEHKQLITNNIEDNKKKSFSYIAFSIEEINEYVKELIKLEKDSIQSINDLNQRIIVMRKIEQLKELKQEINHKLTLHKK